MSDALTSATSEACERCGRLIPLDNLPLHQLRCTAPTPPQPSSTLGDQVRRRPAPSSIRRHPDAEDTPGDSETASSHGAPQWACGRCTFLNSADDPRCEMCAGERPRTGDPSGDGERPSPAGDGDDGPPPLRQRGPGRPEVQVVRRTMAPGVTFTSVRTVHRGARNEAQSSPSDHAQQQQASDGLYGGAIRGGIGGALLSGAVAAATGRSVGQAMWNGGLYGAVVGGAVNELGGMMDMANNRPPPPDVETQQQQRAPRRPGMDGPAGGQDFSDMAEALARQVFGGFGGGGGGEPSYEQLLQMFGAPERPRANPGVVSDLPTHTIETEEEADRLPEDRSTCCVCMEKFVIRDTTKSLPCFHTFHNECIDRWLARANTCPICTQPLPN